MPPIRLMTEPSLWLPISDPIALAILGKWSEELGELQSAISRCIIQGLDGQHPTSGKPNQEWLEDELADCQAISSIALSHFGLAVDVARTDMKIYYKRTWLEMIRQHFRGN